MLRTTIIAIAIAIFGSTNDVSAASPYEFDWLHQYGTAGVDIAEDVAVGPTGQIYVVGHTQGSLGEPNPQGNAAGFLSRFEPSGEHVWTRHVSDVWGSEAFTAAIDGLGNIYVSGLYSAVNGDSDPSNNAYLVKFNEQGTLQWTRLFGNGIGIEDPNSGGYVATDAAGTSYIVGYSGGSPGGNYLTKVDTDGNTIWTHHSSEIGAVIPTSFVMHDGMNSVYAAGGGEGAVLTKFDEDGIMQWTRSIGDPLFTSAQGIATDTEGNVFITGTTGADLTGEHAGLLDAFVSKFDTSGTLLWTRQFGAEGNDEGYRVATDLAGNVFASGLISDIANGTPTGDTDLFVTMLDTEGEVLWTRTFGSDAMDFGPGIAVGAIGEVYVAGATFGLLGSEHLGSWDVYVARLSVPVPEPNGILMAIAGAMILCRLGRTTRRQMRSTSLQGLARRRSGTAERHCRHPSSP